VAALAPYLLILVAALSAVGCGGPTKPSTLGPILVCPAPWTVASTDGNATPVVYEPPSLIAGEPPIKQTCSPASGALFVIGNSTVTCTATDAALRTDSCSFSVTVTRPATISATRFMAFGNSITEGKLGDGSGTIISNNYPEVLRSLLAARYTSQTISVVNKGFGGEVTSAGAIRLTDELDDVRPDVLLLEEGINDLGGGNQSAIVPLIDSLRAMVREAQRRGATVFLATLAPVRAGSEKGGRAFPLVPEANDRIRILATNERANLVDLFAGFGGIPGPYIDADGLHPNALGYQKIAELFYEQIRAKLEGPAASVPAFARNMPLPDMPGTRLR
jgi:lysophospholipase L1-like esterase